MCGLIVLIALCFVGYAPFASCELHGKYFVDDYSGTWTKFDGIGAISGGGVCVLFYLCLSDEIIAIPGPTYN